MESKWRLNVPWYGFGDSWWRLCARMLPPMDMYLLVRDESGTAPYGTQWNVPPLGGLPTYVGHWNGTPGVTSFPYGTPVEPD